MITAQLSTALADVDGEDDQVYLCDFELGGPTQLTFEGENDHVVWSADGKRIAFSSQRDGSDDWDLYVKTVDGSDSSAAPVLRGFDAHPDGSHLVVEVRRVEPQTAQDETGVRQQVVVILDWFEDLKRALGER